MSPDQQALDLYAPQPLDLQHAAAVDILIRNGDPLQDRPTIRDDVRDLQLGDVIAGPNGSPVTISAVGEMLWADPFGRVSRDVWATDNATGDPVRLQVKPGVPIPLVKEG